jgi:hypothetical protein
MDSRKRKRSNDRPTLDEFHHILKQVAPDQKFTKAAVESLRHIYFSFLGEIASSLVRLDKVLENDGTVSKACGLGGNSLFIAWQQEGHQLLQAKKNSSFTSLRRSKPKLPKQVTQEMEAEQERLIKKSMDAHKDRLITK